jgi:hypothetical protein
MIWAYGFIAAIWLLPLLMVIALTAAWAVSVSARRWIRVQLLGPEPSAETQRPRWP